MNVYIYRAGAYYIIQTADEHVWVGERFATLDAAKRWASSHGYFVVAFSGVLVSTRNPI